MLTELGRRVVDLSWELQQIENLKKKNQTELKNTQGGINSRLEDAKERISDLEDRVMGSTQVEKQNKKQKEKEVKIG